MDGCRHSWLRQESWGCLGDLRHLHAVCVGEGGRGGAGERGERDRDREREREREPEKKECVHRKRLRCMS